MPDWTLEAWIEHAKALRAADQALIEVHWELDREREQHQRELAETERRYNSAHFHVLNENAKRTVEERGHFVSKDEFDPFRDAVLEYQARRSGTREGGDRLLSTTIAVAGFLFGLTGIIIAVILAVTGG